MRNVVIFCGIEAMVLSSGYRRWSFEDEARACL
jgi:hypothetical protein